MGTKSRICAFWISSGKCWNADTCMCEFAKSLQITPESVSTMISGKTNPSAQTIQQICDKYGYDPEWLKTGEVYPKMTKPRQEQLAAAFGRAMAGTSVSANLISSIALALDRLDDDRAAAVVELLTRIVESYSSLESSETKGSDPE